MENDNQQQAQDKNAVPASANETAAEDHSKAAEAAQQYAKQNEAVKDQVTKYGFKDVDALVTALTSNTLFARAFVMDVFGEEDFKPAVVSGVAGSPQEHNVTGILDHSEYPAKLKEAQDASVPDATPEAVN